MARNKTGPLLKYLDQQLSSEALAAERRKQLKRISTIRKRPILVMAADLNNNSSVKADELSIEYRDIICIQNLIKEFEGEAIDVLLETPGRKCRSCGGYCQTFTQSFQNSRFYYSWVGEKRGYHDGDGWQ